jgi:Spy/CpxP family protein refolding chaperone
MHPGMMYWWNNARRAAAECGSWAGHGGEGGRHGGHGQWAAGGHDGPDFAGGGRFGVRRPLRYLAHKLDLDEKQVAELAKILDELKTERAQAEVDERRTLSAFADAVSSAAFDEARATEAARLRAATADRLAGAVHKALRQIHALLQEEQRGRLGYLIRTGVVSL